MTLKRYDAAIDYEAVRIRLETVTEMGAIPPRGGGRAVPGDRRVIEFGAGKDAWSVEVVPQGRGRAARIGEQPPIAEPAIAEERLRKIWLTPHGFLKAALGNDATTKSLPGGTEVSFSLGEVRFVGFLNAKGHPQRIQTWVENAVIGDMLVEVRFSDYQQFRDGFSFPMRITEKQNGMTSLDLWMFSVEPNVRVDFAVPDTVRAATPLAVDVKMTKIADGVYHVTGGTHHSVVLEGHSGIAVIEAPLDEARSLAVLSGIRQAMPHKPVRFVVNTHHHFDHAGGLRTYVNEGATVITHQKNSAFYLSAWAGPRTLLPDRLAQSGRTPTFESFDDKYTFNAAGLTFEVHRLVNSPHDDALAIVYLPNQKLLIEADAYTPSAEATPLSANPAACNLYQNIRTLKLAVDRIIPLHGSGLATMDDLRPMCGHRED